MFIAIHTNNSFSFFLFSFSFPLLDRAGAGRYGALGKDIQKFPVADKMVKIIVPIINHRNFCDGVMRSKKKPTLTLVKHKAIRHKGCVTKLRCNPLTMLLGGSMYCTWRPAP